MEIALLQGKNLKADHTLIEITFDGAPKSDIIDLIKSFHPIFMSDYSIDENTLTIHSKLTHLWKEAAPTLNRYFTGEINYQEAHKVIVDGVIKTQIYSMSTISTLEAASNLGYEITQAYQKEGIAYSDEEKLIGSQWNRYYRIGCGQQSAITVSSGSSNDPIIALKTQRDKYITNSFVERLGIKLAPWELIHSESHLKEIFEKYPKPVVIKPVGLTQGSGVTTNILTIEQALSAYKYAQDRINGKIRSGWQTKILIQQQVSGDDYRILVVGGDFQIATKRVPAYVIGDGTSTIKELIEQTNTDPRRDMSNPAHILKPIQFDQMLDQYLAEQNLGLEYVPDQDKKIFVRKVASMSQGGLTEDFTDAVHPQIRYMAETIASSVHAHVVGIDVICNDISKPLTIENGSFIEMNTMPEAYLNLYPAVGRSYPEVAERIVEGLVEDIEPTNRVVVIGHDRSEIPELLTSNGIELKQERIGTYSEGSIYINDILMNDNIPTWEAVEMLKLNASLSTIVLHYKSISEVEEFGYGFDEIDILID